MEPVYQLISMMYEFYGVEYHINDYGEANDHQIKKINVNGH